MPIRVARLARMSRVGLGVLLAAVVGLLVGLHTAGRVATLNSDSLADDDRADDEMRIAVLEARVNELEDNLDEAESTLDEARTAMSTLRSDVDDLSRASRDLKSAVEDFDYYDWSSVVPSVTDASDEVARHASDVETETDQLEIILGP